MADRLSVRIFRIAVPSTVVVQARSDSRPFSGISKSIGLLTGSSSPNGSWLNFYAYDAKHIDIE